MEERYCQSCGMPMGATDEMYGTNADGGKSGDYCHYCYADGKFTRECTMDEMIAFCAPHMASAGSGMDEDEAVKMMQGFFPTMKRWKTG